MNYEWVIYIKALHREFLLALFILLLLALPTELSISRNGNTTNINPYPQDNSTYYQLSSPSDNDTSSWILLNEESISTVWPNDSYEITFSTCSGTENITFIIGLC